MIRQRARVEVLEKELGAAAAAARTSMQMRMDVLKARLEAAASKVAEQRDRAVDSALESHDYIEAKREYENAQAMSQAMKKQHSSKRIALRIPKFPVTVHEKPRIGQAPVSPDVDAYLTTGKLGGAAIGAVLALLIGVVRLAGGRSGRGGDGKD